MPKQLSRVEAANSLDDAAYEASFLPELNVDVAGLVLEFASAAGLAKRQQDTEEDKSDLEACFQLLKSTSIDDYKASRIGWNTAEKRKEMILPDMRYVLVRDDRDKSIQGFISFMITYEDGFEVVYIYEVHLNEAMRGKRIGTKLVEMVEEVGKRALVKKAMLTVFNRNKNAVRFYERMGYITDDYSPQPRILRSGVIKEPDYRILSKELRKRSNDA